MKQKKKEKKGDSSFINIVLAKRDEVLELLRRIDREVKEMIYSLDINKFFQYIFLLSIKIAISLLIYFQIC